MKRLVYFLLIVVLLVSVSACVRSMNPSQSRESEQPDVSQVTPGSKGELMDQLELFVTQTAIAVQGGEAPVEGETQPGQGTEPGTGEATPESGATAPEGEATAPEGGATAPEGGEAAPEGGATAPEGEAAQPTATPETQPTPEPVTAPEATPMPVVEVPPATPGIPTTHTIQDGESVFCISRRYNLNPNEVMSLNGLTGSLVRPGDVLKIPQTGNPFPSERALHPHPTTYTVGSGESIYRVACYFGDVDPMVIASVNNIERPFNLTPGQVLQIP
jgi:LysM repeat protein